MIELDERGKPCPLPVVEAKRAMEAAPAGEAVSVIVDNEIAVQNLKKLAGQKGWGFSAGQTGNGCYQACLSRKGSAAIHTGGRGWAEGSRDGPGTGRKFGYPCMRLFWRRCGSYQFRLYGKRR